MPISTSTARILRFDSFELDLRARELRKSGIRLRLQGQPIQLLAILLESPGRLVTREELRAQLWPSDTFVDFDHSLNNAILRIREVLGDSAGTPRYIETLPRRGYRFIGQVEEVATDTPEPLPQLIPPAAASAPIRAQRIRRFLIPSILLPVLLIFAAAGALWLVPYVHRASAAPIHSVAVLPFDNLSGDPSQGYLADGMTDQLTTDLVQVGSLRVISRATMMHYRNTNKTLPEIARELNVDSVVEGSITRSGDRVRVTAQLLRANTDENIWADSYDRNVGDILRLQSDVAQAIAEHVRADLTPQQKAHLRFAPTVDSAAYEDYLRGRYLFTNYFFSGPQMKIAQNYFQQSIRKDPNFAPAYAGLADSYLYLAFDRELSPEIAYRSAQQALARALQLDPDVGEAHEALAVMRWRYEWDWAGAEREFRATIALAPSYDCAHEDYSGFLSFTGQRAEALAEITKSHELNPAFSLDEAESALYYQQRDYKALVGTNLRSVASDPNNWLDHYNLGVGYAGSRQLAQAIPEYQKAVELSGGDQDATAALAHAYAISGRRSDAEKILKDMLSRSKTSYVSPYMIATIYAGLGDKDQAFAFLEKAYQEKSPDISWSFKSDLRLDNLRSDPRFHSLLQRIQLPAPPDSQS
jgi:TolB-like protein/DNA-binding winged helix-turn-helix (wHTH) protein/cytochrome c-type biogenesis protein CcmH/NrfG